MFSAFAIRFHKPSPCVKGSHALLFCRARTRDSCVQGSYAIHSTTEMWVLHSFIIPPLHLYLMDSVNYPRSYSSWQIINEFWIPMTSRSRGWDYHVCGLPEHKYGIAGEGRVYTNSITRTIHKFWSLSPLPSFIEGGGTLCPWHINN